MSASLAAVPLTVCTRPEATSTPICAFIPKMLWGERRGCCTLGAVQRLPMERLMSQPFDASRSLTALDQDSTIIVVIEMSQSKWLVAAGVPGNERPPPQKARADKETPAQPPPP